MTTLLELTNGKGQGPALDQGAALMARPSAGALDMADRTAAASTLGQAANVAAGAAAFADYRRRKSANTLRNHGAALDHFGRFLVGLAGRVEAAAGDGAALDAGALDQAAAWADLDGAALATSAGAWRGVTWGIVEAWKQSILQEGYSVGTVNNRLSVVRVYAGLASRAGAIPADELTHIAAVAGYGATEGRRVDERRPRARVGAKKGAAVPLSLDQARRLKTAAGPTGQAARDVLIMALLLDHGLRIGELAALTVGALDLDAGLMTFYRPKVDKTQTHRLTAAALTAARRYLVERPAGAGPGLWVASDRRGRLLPRPMSSRAIAKRVGLLGAGVEAVGLSPHDCRHYWATTAAAAGTGVFSLRDAGGWSSVAMPARYVEGAAVANDGVILYQ
jgi:integrase